MSVGAPTDPATGTTLEDAAAPSRGPRGWRRVWEKYGLAFLFTICLIVLWEVTLRVTHTHEYLLPKPTDIVRAFQADWSEILWPNTWPTVAEILMGFAISVVAGIGLAILLHLFAPLRRTTYPLLIGSQTIPIVVLAPILVILFGFGTLPKVIIVALICFFPIVVNGLDGLRTVDDDFIRMMRTLDATRYGIFRRVEFPAALPSIFSGMRIAATFAAIGAVFGEWAGSNRGLGFVMLASGPTLETSRIFAAILILTGIALLLFALVSALERILVPWASRGGSM